MQNKINWINLSAMLTFHAGALVAIIFFPSIPMLLTAVTVYSVGLCPGIGGGWHRLLTHRGFVVPKFIEYGQTLCGYLTVQGGAIWWVAVHRLHHNKSDKPGEDPHTPKDGGWWAHNDWLVHQDRRLKDRAFLKKWAPDLCRDKVHVFLNDHAWLPITVFGLLIFAIFGFVTMMWAVFVPVTFGWHSTWLVNSATHLWGSRRFETDDDSRNSWWVALLTFGEGWHNNHHAAPVLARHGLRWYEIDFNWYFIWTLWVLGLAKSVKR